MARPQGAKNKVRKPKSTDGLKKGQIHIKDKNRDEKGHFSFGNDLWRVAGIGGSEKAFATPEKLWEAYLSYSEWNDKNPMMAAELYKGKIKSMPKMRVKTLEAFCEYVGVAASYFRNFKLEERKDKAAYTAVIYKIEQSIKSQSFGGAAAGFLNANIISRHLGLVDRQDRTSGDQPIQPPRIEIIKNGTPKLSKDEKEVKGKDEN